LLRYAERKAVRRLNPDITYATSLAKKAGESPLQVEKGVEK
tara:strand:+ start:53 stop:175 length:123 start_codon:yes stop_codon:yes gene_type:complete